MNFYLEHLQSLAFAAFHYVCPFFHLPPGVQAPADESGPPLLLQLPILRQLRRFLFFTYDSGVCILSALRKYAASEPLNIKGKLEIKLKELEVYSAAYSEEVVQQYLEDLPLGLQERFTGVSLFAITGSQLSALVCRFTRLATLELGLPEGRLSLPHLTASLAGLPALRRLELTMDVEEYMAVQRLPPTDEEALSSHRAALTPLPGVLALQLNLKAKCHERAEGVLSLAVAFPRLAVLKFHCRNLPCITCSRIPFLKTLRNDFLRQQQQLRSGAVPDEACTRRLQPAKVLLARLLQMREECAKAAIGWQFFEEEGRASKLFLKLSDS